MAVSAQLAQEWLGDDYEDEDVVYLDQEEQDYDEEDEEDYGPGVTIFRAPPSPEPEPTTDLAEQAYTDPLALVNAWEGALQDYKDSHPDQFLPPAEAPRTLAQKKVKAPFWYGPPPSEASTSKLVQTTTTTTAIMVEQEPRQAVQVTYESYFGESPAQVEQGEGGGVEQEQTAEPEDEEEEGGEGTQRRKRKRLTGSQKKARKAAKLGLKSTAGGSGGGGGAEAAETTVRQPSPIYSPRSPKFQAAALPVDVPATTSSASASVPSSLPPNRSSSTLATQSSGVPTPFNNDPNPSGPAAEAPPPPSAFRFLVPPMSTLPRQFPPPPAITPLTGTEPPLDPETPEQLLESALWSWYSAGYQTALYHAAVGVAKFASSAETSEE